MIVKRPIANVADLMSKAVKPMEAKAWSRGTPEDWANESHAVAVKVYADVREDGPPPTVPPAYVGKNVPVVAQQIKRGGVRLAFVLNACSNDTEGSRRSPALRARNPRRTGRLGGLGGD